MSLRRSRLGLSLAPSRHALFLLALSCGTDTTAFVDAPARPAGAELPGGASARPLPGAQLPAAPIGPGPGDGAPGADGATRDDGAPASVTAVPTASDASVGTEPPPADHVPPSAAPTPAEPQPVPPVVDEGVDAGVPPNGPRPPLVAGLTARPEAAAFLGMPVVGKFALRGWDMVDVFPSLFFDDSTFLIEEPTTGRLFVTERSGRIFAFENRNDVTTRTLVLDISAQTVGNGDRGLVGLAFQPEFGRSGSPNAGYVYVHYPHIDPATERPLPDSVLTHSRLSRFTVDLNTLQADPASELVLIDQFDESPLHLGGALFFRPSDGYLYVSVGDEGLPCSQSNNCGRIDKDLFSGVLRIDVNPIADSDSHAIRKQPEAGVTANYTIPNDNPFVGVPGALEEFYALGVRSPHRMTVDPVDDIVWLGDVGANSREEIDVVTSGANLQWNASEGLLRYVTPASVVGKWTDPVLDFTRADARCIVGGYVYRGQRFPELSGKYVFADFIYNTLWAADYARDGERVEVVQNRRLATAVAGRRASLTSLAVDARGELYMTSLGHDHIKTLTFREAGSTNLPAHLSGTGVFQDTATLTPSPALLGYTVKSPLWSDGASKRRWLGLPAGAKIGFAANGAWTFPAGSVFVKHFEMAMDERVPEQRRRLETRILVAPTSGDYYGATYRWNAEGTDADLLLESRYEALEITQSDGSTRQQEYFYPGPTDCSTCHNARAGYVLGVRTAQLNAPIAYDGAGPAADQLWTWSQIGMFDRTLSEDEVRGLPSLAALGDESRSVEDRVRSYWDSNCSMCHGADPGIRASWDARYQVPLADQAVIGAPSFETDGTIVVPGDVEASLMVVRDRSTDPDRRMPPLGRTRADAEYIALLERWVRSLPAAPAAAPH